MNAINLSRLPLRGRTWAVVVLGAAAAFGAPHAASARIFAKELAISPPLVGVYTNAGTPITALFGFDPGTSPEGIALSGTNVFVGDFAGMIHKFTIDGNFVDLYPSGGTHIVNLAASETHLFVLFESGVVGKYTFNGVPVNAAFITGLNPAETGIAVSGSRLLLTNPGGVAEYDAGTGTLVNPLLVAAITPSSLIASISVSGGRLICSYPFFGTIAEYDALTGDVINDALITGLDLNFGVAASGPRLLFEHGVVIGQYDLESESLINSAKITSALVGLLDFAATPYGDLNEDNDVDDQDYLTLAAHLHTDVSAMTLDQAAALGHLTGDKKIDGNDFADFRLSYEDIHGPGSFVALVTGLPEPATRKPTLIALACLAAAGRRRQASPRDLQHAAN